MTGLDHLNTKLVCYSDPHRSWLFRSQLQMWFRLEVRLNSQGHYLWQQQFRHNRSEFGRWSENYHHTKKGSPLYILTRHVQHFMCPTFFSLTPSKNFHLIYQLSSLHFAKNKFRLRSFLMQRKTRAKIEQQTFSVFSFVHNKHTHTHARTHTHAHTQQKCNVQVSKSFQIKTSLRSYLVKFIHLFVKS